MKGKDTKTLIHREYKKNTSERVINKGLSLTVQVQRRKEETVWAAKRDWPSSQKLEAIKPNKRKGQLCKFLGQISAAASSGGTIQAVWCTRTAMFCCRFFFSCFLNGLFSQCRSPCKLGVILMKSWYLKTRIFCVYFGDWLVVLADFIFQLNFQQVYFILWAKEFSLN